MGRRNKAHGDALRAVGSRRQPPPSFSFPSPRRGRRNRGDPARRAPAVPPPPSGAGEGVEGWLSPSRIPRLRRAIAVGFIPPPHTGLGPLPQKGSCPQACYCTRAHRTGWQAGGRILRWQSAWFLAAGMSARRRLLMVSHTERGDRIRLIRARELTRAEREAYENEKARRRV